MILESAQLLCCALPVNISKYKHTHVNHPCSKWTRLSKQNYLWLVSLSLELGSEYQKTYFKTHKSIEVVKDCVSKIDKVLFLESEFTSPPLCMPKQYITNSAVWSYRNYYKAEKAKFAKWKKREIPSWW